MVDSRSLGIYKESKIMKNNFCKYEHVMIMACEKASKSLIRDFGEIEKLQVSVKGPSDFVSSADKKS